MVFRSLLPGSVPAANATRGPLRGRFALDPGARAAAPLAAGEARRALGRGDVDLRRCAGLELESLVERQALRGEGGRAVGEHRLLGEARQRLGVLERAAERAAVQLGDEAHPVRLAGVDDAAGEDQVERAAE